MQSIMLVAHELDLGSCCVAAFDEKKVRNVLEIPEDVCVLAMIPIGYPLEKMDPVNDRKSFADIVHYQRW